MPPSSPPSLKAESRVIYSYMNEVSSFAVVVCIEDHGTVQELAFAQ